MNDLKLLDNFILFSKIFLVLRNILPPNPEPYILEFGPLFISICSKIFKPKSSIFSSPTPFVRGILSIYALILFVEYGDLEPMPLIVILFVLKPAECANIPAISFIELIINCPSLLLSSKSDTIEVETELFFNFLILRSEFIII